MDRPGAPFGGRPRYGLGFGLDSPDFAAPTPTSIHWGGYGGSFLSMDPAKGVSRGFTPNQLMIGDDSRMTGYWRVLGEISDELG